MTADSDAAQGTAAAHRLDNADPPELMIVTAALPPPGDTVGVPAAAYLTWHADSASLRLKRAFDVVGAALLLTLTGPLLLALAAVIRLRRGGPVIFRQLRVTGPGRVAHVLKLRTLAEHGDSDTRWSITDDQSTRLGRWLRASHLDELPQLVNVLRGEMSLVGPRPERPYFVDCFSTVIPDYNARHRMPAGLTGWAQVHGLHGDSSIADRVRFDNYYIEHWSLWLDVLILLKTLGAAVSALRPGRR